MKRWIGTVISAFLAGCVLFFALYTDAGQTQTTEANNTPSVSSRLAEMEKRIARLWEELYKQHDVTQQWWDLANKSLQSVSKVS